MYIGKYLVACDSDKYGKKLTVKDGTIGIADGAVMPQVVLSNGKIKTVTLPNSVRFVGKDAFSNSKNIAKIKLGNRIERIGKDAFKGTKFYKSNAKTASNAKYIGKYLCEGVYGKKSVKVKNGTTVIAMVRLILATESRNLKKSLCRQASRLSATQRLRIQN